MLRPLTPDMLSQTRVACGCPCIGFCAGDAQITCSCPCSGACTSDGWSTPQGTPTPDPSLVNDRHASSPRQPSSRIHVPRMATGPSTSNNRTISQNAHPHSSYITRTTVPGPSTSNHRRVSPPRQQNMRSSSSTNADPRTSNRLPATHQQNEQRSTARTSRRTPHINNSPDTVPQPRRSELLSTSPVVNNYKPQPAVSTSSLHSVLMYTVLRRPDCDFRFSPSTWWKFRGSIPLEALSQPAVTPPVTELQLSLAHLPPWPIKVVPTQSSESGMYYVSIRDVFNAIYTCLRARLSTEDFTDFPKRFLYPRIIRKKVRLAFRARCRNSEVFQDEWENGMRRIDLLMGRTRFRGIARSETSLAEWIILCD